MSYVVVASELLTATAVDLSALGSSLNAANFAAAASTTAVAAAGMDEVSTAIASLFSGHAQVYQELGRQAAVFHAQFVDALTRAGASYASAEAVSATPLQLLEQQVLGLINAPAQAILGRPLIGNGADGRRPERPVLPVGCCTATAATARPG
ncbi:PE family protein [Mycobacterium kansasii]|uniref:PE family protein n=1 Tax=Mycobacterium kansasii TaxID=1768 RepID=A0A1V3WTU1_MYCKA|nr:PE family protein [Mycobacterium kansasii]OOK74665.1 PE family protein [Mycobacterium kansasii]